AVIRRRAARRSGGDDRQLWRGETVSKYRSTPAPAPSVPASAGPIRAFVQAWIRFWFTPADPFGLHVLRVLAGILFLCWLLPFAGQVDALFGLQGWFDRQAYIEAAQIPEGPPQPIGWSILYLCGGNATLLNIMYWASITVLVLFTLGMGTRITSALSWAIVVSFTANPAIGYDADALLIILAFYLMIGYLLIGLRDRDQSRLAWLFGSPAHWLLGTRASTPSAPPSVAANLALRLLQVNFAIVMVRSGLHNLQFGDWWSGAAFWYPLHPPFATPIEQARAHASNAAVYLTFLSVGAYATLAWQIAFPLFAWRPRWRFLSLGGAVFGW